MVFKVKLFILSKRGSCDQWETQYSVNVVLKYDVHRFIP